MTPPDLEAKVRGVMEDVMARRGFETYISHGEIGDALGGEGPQRWRTIDFTADPRWL